MVLFSIDNYKIHKEPIKSNSNYNVSIRIEKDGEMICGWHEKSNVSDLEIIKQFIKSVEQAEKRSMANTFEDLMAV